MCWIGSNQHRRTLFVVAVVVDTAIEIQQIAGSRTRFMRRGGSVGV